MSDLSNAFPISDSTVTHHTLESTIEPVAPAVPEPTVTHHTLESTIEPVAPAVPEPTVTHHTLESTIEPVAPVVPEPTVTHHTLESTIEPVAPVVPEPTVTHALESTIQPVLPCHIPTQDSCLVEGEALSALENASDCASQNECENSTVTMPVVLSANRELIVNEATSVEAILQPETRPLHILYSKYVEMVQKYKLPSEKVLIAIMVIAILAIVAEVIFMYLKGK